MFNSKKERMTKKLGLLVLAIGFVQCSSYEKEEVSTLNREENAEIITLRSGARVEKREGVYLYLGDIALSKEQLKGLDEYGDLFYYQKKTAYKGVFRPEYGIPHPKSSRRSDVSANLDYLSSFVPKVVAEKPGTHWGMVRFTFDATLSGTHKNIIQSTLDAMELLTNVRFYNATGEPTIDSLSGMPYNYINFYKSTVNSSSVGSIGGKQTINLISFNNQTIMHEILHALGLFHEQSRPDRDSYIDIHLSNVPIANQHNFDRVVSNYLTIGAFDFNSIMLYDSYAFSNNGLPTITKKDGSTFTDNTIMSDLDRQFVNTYYIPYKVNPNGSRILLDTIVYKSDNMVMSDKERINFERALNGEPPI